MPQAAGLELSARLMAARPWWDVEVDEAKISLCFELVRGEVDAELTVLEEACAHLERTKNIKIENFWLSKVAEKPAQSCPAALGPWRLEVLNEGDAAPAPRPDRLILPPRSSASKRFWAGENLALSAALEHLTPPPGAPETRGKSVLVLGHGLPLVPTAALLAGAREAILVSDEGACGFAKSAAAFNGKAAALKCSSENFADFCAKQDREDSFGLIVLHLSPYLAIRRLKTLVGFLAQDGAMIVSGFAPGPQTAQLLRSAAKNGLILAASNTEGVWAAMKLEPAPAREDLPPLTGSVVPALMDLPPEDFPQEAREDEIPDEESLIIDEDIEEEL